MRSLGPLFDQFGQDFQLGIFRLGSSRRHPGAGDLHLRDLLQQRLSGLSEGLDVIAFANQSGPSLGFKGAFQALLNWINRHD